MTSATNYLTGAELALAAYANLQLGGTGSDANISTLAPIADPRASPTQVREFARRYPTIVASYNDLPSSGFQATVFKDTAGTGTPGNLTVAFRGSELSGGDYVPTGADILLAGTAYDQIVAMVNWWNRASAPSSETVAQFRLAWMPTIEVPADAAVLGIDGDRSHVLASADSVPGEGGELAAALALDPDGRVEVTGHSLGGHLAMAFSTIFGSSTAGVTVFNAPGFIDNATNRAFFEKLGGSIPAAGASNITNVIADEALVGEAPFGAIARRKGADSGDTAGIGGGRQRATHERPRTCSGRREMTSRKKAKTFLKVAAAVVLSSALAGCMGWVPGRQSYWDAKVKEMCEKDGGVQILEVLRISKSDLNFLGSADGMIDVPIESLANLDSPAYAVNKLQVLREGNPAVWRSEWEITRRSDHVVVARTVSYTRSGGDVPSPAHESRYTCPDPKKILADLQRLFVLEDDTK